VSGVAAAASVRAALSRVACEARGSVASVSARSAGSLVASFEQHRVEQRNAAANRIDVRHWAVIRAFG
jgi:hypothetical protein